jgi:hypothetical protein
MKVCPHGYAIDTGRTPNLSSMSLLAESFCQVVTTAKESFITMYLLSTCLREYFFDAYLLCFSFSYQFISGESSEFSFEDFGLAVNASP